MSTLRHQVPGLVPHLTVLLEEAAGDEPRREEAHRSQPGVGHARMCAVSSTVGVQATGRWALKIVGGKASTAKAERDRVERLVVGEPKPTAHPRLAARRAVCEPRSSGWSREVDPAHERWGELLGGPHRLALVGRRQIRGPDTH